MAESLLERIIIEPKVPATSSVIWLHGLGASGDDFSDIIPLLRLPQDHRMRFIFPHAPIQPVTINGGMKMPAWYDIQKIDLLKSEDEAGLKRTEIRLHNLIAHEQQQGIASEQIVIMGFSQGGAVALYTGLRYPQRLAGVASLSGYLPMASTLEKEKRPENMNIPIWIAHGLVDPVVPYMQAMQSYTKLAELGYGPEQNAYGMAHMVCEEECLAIGRWLQKILTP